MPAPERPRIYSFTTGERRRHPSDGILHIDWSARDCDATSMIQTHSEVRGIEQWYAWQLADFPQVYGD